MSEVGFFSNYDKNEDRITNYTLLVLKQLYNENPVLFQELIVNLLSNECENIKVGVNFLQQKASLGKQGKSTFDGLIQQEAFNIVIETKLSDWFYEEQLKRHLENLKQRNGQNIFLAISNFDGYTDKKNLFDNLKNQYQDNIIIQYIEFEDLNIELNNILKKIKSGILATIIQEYDQFLNEESLLPTWKYRLDVVNCKKSKKDVLKYKAYMCPAAKGAYKHRRAKYIGLYQNKTVDTVAEIRAVFNVDYDEDQVFVELSWQNDSSEDNQIKNEALNIAQKYGWGEPFQIFLLNNMRNNVNFQKDTKYGLQSSKKYFLFDKNIQNIDDLVEKIKNKSWSNYLD